MNHIKTARRLRQTQTSTEALFWDAVRNRKFLGLKWRRQVPIDRYFADFVCEEMKTIVELDGGDHENQRDYDSNRTKVLNQNGYQVIRFWNDEVKRDLDAVLYSLECRIK